MAKRVLNKTRFALATGLLLITLLLNNESLLAATVTSVVSGGSLNWSSGSTWQGGSIPNSGDDIVIASGTTVTIDIGVTVNNITVNSGGALKANPVTVNITGNLLNNNLSNSFNLIGASQVNINGTSSQIIGGGSGPIYFKNVTINNSASVSTTNTSPSGGITSPAVVIYQGTLTIQSNFTLGTAWLQLYQSDLTWTGGTLDLTTYQSTIQVTADQLFGNTFTAYSNVNLYTIYNDNGIFTLAGSGGTKTFTVYNQYTRNFSSASGGTLNLSSANLAYDQTNSTLAYASSGANLTVGTEYVTTGGAKPSNLYISNGPGSTITLTSAVDTIKNNLTISQGNLAHASASNVVYVGGTVSAGTLSASGSFTTGIIEMSGSGSQSIIGGSGSIVNLRINKTATANTVTTSSSSVKVTNSLDIKVGTLVLGGSLDVSGATFTIESNGAFQTGAQTINTNSSTILSFQPGSTYSFTGSGADNFITTAASGLNSYGNIILNNPSGLTVNSSLALTVQNNLTLTSGVLTTGTQNSAGTVQVNGTASGSSTSYVDGPLAIQVSGSTAKTFPVGNVGGTYNPITITPSSFGSTATITIDQFPGTPTLTVASFPSGISAASTNPYWTFSAVGYTSGTYTLAVYADNVGYGSRSNILFQNAGTNLTNATFTTQASTYLSPNVSATSLAAFPLGSGVLTLGKGGATNAWSATASSTDWATAGNWSAGVPTSADNVTITTSTNYPNIQGAESATANTINISSPATLTISSSASTPLAITSTTAGALTLGAGASLIVTSSATTPINFGGTGYSSTAASYNSTSTVEYDAGTVPANAYGNLTVNTSGSVGTGAGTLTVAGTFLKSGTGTYDAGSGFTMNGSTITVNGGSIVGSGSITLAGGTVKSIGGSVSPINLSNLTVNNGSALTTLNKPVTLSGTLALTSGNVQSTGGNLLTAAGITGGGSGSYVNGPLALPTSSNITFPIGKSTYHPVAATISGTSPYVSFEVFDGSANQYVDVTLNHVSYQHYYYGNVTSGSISAGGSITINYYADDSVTTAVISPVNNLRVAYSPDNGTTSYTSYGGTGSAIGTGQITSNAVLGTTLGYFALASTANDGTLPVELVSFDATPVQQGVTLANSVGLKWETKSETNNAGYELFRVDSVTGQSTKIASYLATSPVYNSAMKGLGNSPSGKVYTISDRSVVAGKTYIYKLVDVDYAGRTESFQTGSVKIAQATTYVLGQNYPNPFNPSTTINYSVPKAGKVELKVYDVLGREVQVLVNDVKPAGAYSIIFNANNLSSGAYFYQMKADGFAQTKKLTLVK
jgi:fibronectin-binding autotransporter adhesin